MIARTSAQTPIFFYLAMAFLLVICIRAVVFALSRKPLRYRERILEGSPLAPPPQGRFQTYPLRLNLIRVAIFILVMALSLETLFRYHYYFFGGLFVLLEFAIYIYLLDSFDKSQPRLRSLAIVRNDLLLEFENSERYPNRLVRLIDVESFCPFLSGRYVGFGDRRPYKPNPLGIGIFGHSDELLFYIPIYMENYFEIVRWIASALPLRHAPPILLDKTE